MLPEKATFGAGCLWGVEAAFRNMEGVVVVAVGYMGGRYLESEAARLARFRASQSPSMIAQRANPRARVRCVSSAGNGKLRGLLGKAE